MLVLLCDDAMMVCGCSCEPRDARNLTICFLEFNVMYIGHVVFGRILEVYGRL
jgi:hypothetical protein